MSAAWSKGVSLVIYIQSQTIVFSLRGCMSYFELLPALSLDDIVEKAHDIPVVVPDSLVHFIPLCLARPQQRAFPQLDISR